MNSKNSQPTPLPIIKNRNSIWLMLAAMCVTLLFSGCENSCKDLSDLRTYLFHLQSAIEQSLQLKKLNSNSLCQILYQESKEHLSLEQYLVLASEKANLAAERVFTDEYNYCGSDAPQYSRRVCEDPIAEGIRPPFGRFCYFETFCYRPKEGYQNAKQLAVDLKRIKNLLVYSCSYRFQTDDRDLSIALEYLEMTKKVISNALKNADLVYEKAQCSVH